MFKRTQICTGVLLALSGSAWVSPMTVVFLAGGVLLGVEAQAQQSAGAINGRGAAGDVITIENKSIGIQRTVKVDADGVWQASQLPAGEYDVSITRTGGAKETVRVSVSAGLSSYAAFAGSSQTVTVAGSVIRTIDTSTPTSAFTLSRAEIDRTPVAPNVTAVTLLAPGATQGDGRLGGTAVRSGNLASISGSSVAENAYYINGFNVTNITKGLAFNEVPFQAVGEIQVNNSGYGAEFGRSLGGVISVNTKRGTNEWKGGVSFSHSPNWLRGTSVYADKSALTGSYNLVGRPGTSELTEANLYAGGPLIKDTLYVFALIQGTQGKDQTYNEFNQSIFKNDSPKYLVKVDWNVNKDNIFELTAFSDKNKEKVSNYSAVAPYQEARGAFNGTDTYTTGGSNVIAKWTSFITQDLNISALAGVGNYSRSNSIAASACPAVYDGRPPRATLEYLGCWSESAGILIDDPNAKDKRTAFRLDAEWTVSSHKLRGGLDYEVYDTVDGGVYTGGFYDRLFTLAPGGTIGGTGYTNTTGASQDYVRHRVFSNGGTFKTKNAAFYFEDNWQITKDLMANIGIRNETFTNLNDKGQPFVKVKNTWAPRAGLSWDLAGNGTTKLYTNAGRYYIPVYANTNVRLSGSETFYTDFYAFDGTFSTDGRSVPGYGAQLGNRVTTSDGSPKDPRSVVDPNLKPMFQDEFILGFQQALSNRWNFGVKYTNRRLKSAMDDICEGKLAGEWAVANGYSADQADAIASAIGNCFLYNVGGDLTANVDLDGNGNLSQVKIPASALLMPKPKRTYNGIEFMLERQWDKRWSAQFSYLLSYSKGNTEGYVKSDNGQDDAGITQDFDHPGLMEGSSGYLPNDRRHAFKMSGSFAATDEWRVGASFVLQSGRPKNCFGNYAGAISDDSPNYGAASFYCNGVLTPRGSQGRLPWTKDLSLQFNYTPQWQKGLTFNVNILNVFNNRGTRAIDEVGELDSVGSVNPTYQRPLLSSLQAPRSIRMTLGYEF